MSLLLLLQMKWKKNHPQERQYHLISYTHSISREREKFTWKRYEWGRRWMRKRWISRWGLVHQNSCRRNAIILFLLLSSSLAHLSQSLWTFICCGWCCLQCVGKVMRFFFSLSRSFRVEASKNEWEKKLEPFKKVKFERNVDILILSLFWPSSLFFHCDLFFQIFAFFHS